jgi:hypothetical protein
LSSIYISFNSISFLHLIYSTRRAIQDFVMHFQTFAAISLASSVALAAGPAWEQYAHEHGEEHEQHGKHPAETHGEWHGEHAAHVHARAEPWDIHDQHPHSSGVHYSQSHHSGMHHARTDTHHAHPAGAPHIGGHGSGSEHGDWEHLIARNIPKPPTAADIPKHWDLEFGDGKHIDVSAAYWGVSSDM